MAGAYEFWDPNEWEEYVGGLLHDRHGPTNVMKVPATHRGDFGIDYYCLTARVAYQCYAVQEPCDVADRAHKQKAKITSDLTKFCSRSDVARLFASIKVSRWILLVPIHDSAQVNLHLTTKTAEIRQKGLPYVADDFEVLIHDLDCFDVASREARAAQRRIVDVAIPQPTQTDIENWARDSDPLVAALSTKLEQTPIKLYHSRSRESNLFSEFNRLGIPSRFSPFGYRSSQTTWHKRSDQARSGGPAGRWLVP